MPVYPTGPIAAVGAILAFSALNVLFSWLNNVVLQSPLFLDSIFTAIGAALGGPVPGAAIGLATNLGMEALYGMTGRYGPFAACNVATGLIVGIMTRRGLFRHTGHVTAAVLLVSFVNAILGSFIANLLFSGDTSVQIDHIISAFTETGQSLLAANFWARIPTNLIDKMLAVYAAYGVRALALKRRVSGSPRGGSGRGMLRLTMGKKSTPASRDL